MKLPVILYRARKSVSYVIENHKKGLILGILLLILVVSIATAAVYSYMHMGGRVSVKTTLIYLGLCMKL